MNYDYIVGLFCKENAGGIFLVGIGFLIIGLLMISEFSEYKENHRQRYVEKTTYDIGVANITITTIDNVIVTRMIKGKIVTFDQVVLVFSAKKLFDEWCIKNTKRGLVLLSNDNNIMTYAPINKIKDINVTFEEKYETA